MLVSPSVGLSLCVFQVRRYEKVPRCLLQTILIGRFHKALLEYGLEERELFQTNDLSEKKDIANVTNTIYALGRAVSTLKHEPSAGQAYSSNNPGTNRL